MFLSIYKPLKPSSKFVLRNKISMIRKPLDIMFESDCRYFTVDYSKSERRIACFQNNLKLLRTKGFEVVKDIHRAGMMSSDWSVSVCLILIPHGPNDKSPNSSCMKAFILRQLLRLI
jgi:hypothetical protein